eukprot:scaffold1426_cov263-Pinguiococcus_pyrenoidosus.AAC.6
MGSLSCRVGDTWMLHQPSSTSLSPLPFLTARPYSPFSMTGPSLGMSATWTRLSGSKRSARSCLEGRSGVIADFVRGREKPSGLKGPKKAAKSC